MAVPTSWPNQDGNTVSFATVLAGSIRFKQLFAEGMCLVEESAAYLDGPGRVEARQLNRSLNDAYSAESMRLTTRLMQIASWLLIRRAVSDGEMTQAEATADRVQVRVSAQNMVSSPSIFAQLPDDLQNLTRRSLRLQTRILHLDRMLNGNEPVSEAPMAQRSIDQQFERLRLAYGAVD